ncbi:intermembrane phospholipid transport protein YdbH family protein [Nitrococcus mobilis]|uniref:intermembrane phospholipid transport protein YdbH family protein n=1 Tax=Nitrococcus mobilis TaxID=35797 RepID=UPI0012EA4EB3|nr:YdbH domain-containing protein [Nitrococcus mobilis]
MVSSAQATNVVQRFRIALFFLIGLAALFGAALLTAPYAIDFFGERVLRSAGFANAEIGGVDLAWNGVRIHRLRLAGDQRFVLRDIAVHFSWESLWAGRVRRLSISSARLEAVLGPNGALQLPGLTAQAGAQSKGDAAGTGIPIDAMTLGTATVQLATPAGAVELTLKQAHVQFEGASIRLDSALRVRHAAGAAHGHLQATAHQPGGPVSLRLAIADGEITAAQGHLAGLHGEARVGRSAQGSVAAALDLTAAKAAYRRTVLGPLNLSAHLKGEQVRYRLTSPPAEAVAVDLGGTADLKTRQATLEGRVRLPSLARLPRLKAEGRATLTSKLALDWGVNTPCLTGRLALEGRALMLEGFMEKGRLQLAGAIDATAERIVLTARAPWTAEAILTSSLLPRALRSYAGDRLRLRLGPREPAGPMHLTIHPATGRAVFAAAATLAVGETRLQAGAVLRLQLKEDTVVMTAQPLTLSLDALRLAGLTVGLEGFSGRAAFNSDRSWRLEGAGQLTASGDLGPATLESGWLAWSGRLEGDRAEIRMIPAQCLHVAAKTVAMNGRGLESLELPCLAQKGKAPLLRYAFGLSRWYVAVASARAPLDLRIRAAGKSHSVTGRWPAAMIRGQGGAQGLDDLRISLRDGTLRLAEAQLAAEGIAGTLVLSDGTVETAKLTASAVKSLAQPALWVPLQFEARGIRKDGALAFDAVLSDALGIVVFQAKGQAEEGKAQAALTLYPIQFIPQATEPGDLSPALGALANDMTGTVAFGGRLAWDGQSLKSSGKLRLDEWAATLAGLRFAGLDGRLAFASLAPPITDQLQTLRLATVNIGLLLTDGRVRFALLPDGRLRVAELAFALAGGQLRAEPFILDLSQLDNIQITLYARQVDLAEVVRMSGIEGVEAKGELTGRVPISFGRDGLRVAGGRLQAAGSGVLRYVPQEMPAFLKGDDLRTRMLRQVLQNFQYRQLSLTLGGEVGAEQHLHLQARGANPDFLEGHPVILNVRVNGPLVSVVKSALGGTGAKALERLFKDSEPPNLPPQGERRP